MICLSLADIKYQQCLEIIKQEPLAEIRLDRLELNMEQIDELFALGNSLIATCRPAKYKDEERLVRLKRAIEAGADYVDIEVESGIKYRQALMEIANNNNCKAIISYHNFESTPDVNDLEIIRKQCFNYEADIAKIITTVNTNRDLVNIISLYAKAEDNIIAFGMGEKGKITRVMATLLGAPFTYASLSSGKETAPGQLSKEKLSRLIMKLEAL